MKSGIDKLTACQDEKMLLEDLSFREKVRLPRWLSGSLENCWGRNECHRKKIIIIDHVSEDRHRSGLKNLILIGFTYSLVDICYTFGSVANVNQEFQKTC